MTCAGGFFAWHVFRFISAVLCTGTTFLLTVKHSTVHTYYILYKSSYMPQFRIMEFTLPPTAGFLLHFQWTFHFILRLSHTLMPFWSFPPLPPSLPLVSSPPPLLFKEASMGCILWRFLSWCLVFPLSNLMQLSCQKRIIIFRLTALSRQLE